MENVSIEERDFDEWADLARDDPSAFERMRLAAIDSYIASAPARNRERLRRLQWRIDQERRLARNPLHACVRLSRMMWDNVAGSGGLRERFEQLGSLVDGQPRGVSCSEPFSAPAKVLAFGLAPCRKNRGLQ